MEDQEIRLEIMGLPPSVNELYTVVRGRKILSTAGRRYKNATKLLLLDQLPASVLFTGDTPLSVSYTFYFDHIYNLGYPKTAHSRFRRWDTSNRLKVLEDVVCEVLAVDDSQILTSEVHKCEGEPRVCVRVKAAQDPLISQKPLVT